MKSASNASVLLDCLRRANIDLAAIAASGGGVWLFGSRAVGCARDDSDWDLLVLDPQTMTGHRRKCGKVDTVIVAMAQLDEWRCGELAAHVRDFGIRLDQGQPIEIDACPREAAVRKQALVAERSRFLHRLWAAFTPGQHDTELLRLRRNAHRGWVLAMGHGVPPTALLDAAWSDASSQQRAAILAASHVVPSVGDAMLRAR
jgi:hypothetical protein